MTSLSLCVIGPVRARRWLERRRPRRILFPSPDGDEAPVDTELFAADGIEAVAGRTFDVVLCWWPRGRDTTGFHRPTTVGALVVIAPGDAAEELRRHLDADRDQLLLRPAGVGALRAATERAAHRVLARRQPPDDRALLAFVAVQLTRQQRRFLPVPDPDRAGGWYWPAVVEVFGDGLPGDQPLERLVTQGLAQRAIAERQRRCPICASHHLSYREVCPHCGGADYAPVEGVGPNGAVLHQCRNCPQRFKEGRVEVLCLACGAVGDPADTRERLLYAYELTPAADLAVAERRIATPGLADLVRDHETGIHARSYLAHEAARELTRLASHQVPVALMLVRLVHLAAVRERLPDQAEAHARSLFRLVTSELRPLDVTAIIAGDTLAVLLPQTTLDEAEALVARIVERSAAQPPLPGITGPDLDVTAIAGQPHDRTSDDLIGAAQAALDLPE